MATVNDSRGTMSRLRSTTTRPGRICNDSRRPFMLNPLATAFSLPLTVIFIRTKKIRIRADHPLVAREYGFKFVPRREPKREFDFHASLRRCDPDQVQRVTCISGSQSDDARHP